MLNSSLIDRYLQGFDKADYSAYRIKRDRNVVMSSLLDYAKAEKVLKDSEEIHARLVNNLNLIYSGNTELSHFIRLLRAKKENISYKENSSPTVGLDNPKIFFKNEKSGGKRKLNSKVDKDQSVTRDLTKNCGGKTCTSSKMVLIKSSLKAEDEVMDYAKDVSINSFPKIASHRPQMDPEIRIPKYFDKQEISNVYARENIENVKNKQSRRMYADYQIDDIQKLVRGASGRLIPFLSPFGICSAAVKTQNDVVNDSLKVSRLPKSEKTLIKSSEEDSQNLSQKTLEGVDEAPAHISDSKSSNGEQNKLKDEESLKDVVKQIMNEEINLLLIPQIQSNNKNEHPVISEAIGATAEHANTVVVDDDDDDDDDDDNCVDDWDDYVRVLTPVASEVEDYEPQTKVDDKEELESHTSADEFLADEQPLESCGELRVVTPTRSPSPASTNDQHLKLSEIEAVHQKNEEIKVFKEASVSPMSFSHHSKLDTSLSDNETMETEARTECSVTFDEDISEGQFLISEGELLSMADQDVLHSKKSDTATCSCFSEESSEECIEDVVELEFKQSIGEVHPLTGKYLNCSISEGEIIHMNNQNKGEPDDIFEFTAADDMAATFLSNMGSLLTEFDTTGSTHHENDL